jgi:hypothetical protein
MLKGQLCTRRTRLIGIISYTSFAMQNSMSWVTVSVLTLLDRAPVGSIQNYKIGIYCFPLSMQHLGARARVSKSRYDMFVNRLEMQWASTPTGARSNKVRTLTVTQLMLFCIAKLVYEIIAGFKFISNTDYLMILFFLISYHNC